jgi:carbamoyltransferase
MIILGINGGFRQGYQDVSACIVKNGELIAAVEEERLSRIKFSAGRLPYLSVIEVLKISRLKIQDIDLIAFHGSTWETEIEERIENYFINHFGHSPKIKRYHHHDCHAASTFYASGFDSSLIISLDNSGDGVSLQISKGENGKIGVLKRFDRPNSLGGFYSLITQYCGFVKDSDEYKLMGLSSYGNRKAFDFSWLIDFKDGELKTNEDYLIKVAPKSPSPHRDEMNYNEDFIKKMKKPRRVPKSEIDSFYKDVAASAQEHFENLMVKICLEFLETTGLKNVCLAGGSALNCVMNQKLMNLQEVDNIYIQAASGDAGISLGAAWIASEEHGFKPQKTNHTYLGNSYTNEEVEEILKTSQLKYAKIENPAEIAAELIHKNKVIGWFQGRMEFGPRALGNRSILANACNPEMQEIVNKKIKFRESFRPFCPSVLEEDFDIYFIGKQKVSPFMTITYTVKEEQQKNIPSVSHVDGTARIQTVNEKQNPLFYKLLKHLKEKTGHGVVMNTSFNLSHEPIVCTPRDAIASFYASGMDALIIGNYLLEKS